MEDMDNLNTEDYSNDTKDYDEDMNSQGEALSDKESIINNIFNTKNRIELLRHRLKGDIEKGGYWHTTKNALAPESFINKQISSMESIIDTVNSFSKKNDIEIKKILHESVRAFIEDMGNCREIEVGDFRTLAKTFEHSLELFLGLVEFGHGSKVLRDVSAGLNTEIQEQNKKSGLKEWVSKW